MQNSSPPSGSGQSTNLGKLTRRMILDTIQDYDTRGEHGFFDHYGVPRARHWYILFNGRKYDLKAIVRVACGQPVGDFPNVGIVRRRVERLRFETLNSKTTS